MKPGLRMGLWEFLLFRVPCPQRSAPQGAPALRALQRMPRHCPLAFPGPLTLSTMTPRTNCLLAHPRASRENTGPLPFPEGA